MVPVALAYIAASCMRSVLRRLSSRRARLAERTVGAAFNRRTANSGCKRWEIELAIIATKRVAAIPGRSPRSKSSSGPQLTDDLLAVALGGHANPPSQARRLEVLTGGPPRP